MPARIRGGNAMTLIAPLIASFLRERVTNENTRATYAHAFRLLFEFASKRLRLAPSLIGLEQLDASLALAFLDQIQGARRNGSRTRNARLAAIKSFMRFIEPQVPAALDQVRRIVAIPAHRTDLRLVRHLSAAEAHAVLEAPRRDSKSGIRDRAMIYLALTGGLRVSELVGLQLQDIRFDGRLLEVCVHGKGRKERALLLWKEVGMALRAGSPCVARRAARKCSFPRSEEHTSELQSLAYLVCRLLLEKKKTTCISINCKILCEDLKDV